MQSLKFGLVAAAMVCALSATAQAADCRQGYSPRRNLDPRYRRALLDKRS